MKVLFITVCSDNFVPGLIALIKSIKYYNKNFNYDFKVVHHDEYCKLNEKSKNDLIKEYHNFKFQKVTIEDFKVGKIRIKHPRNNFSLYLSIFAFNQLEYDRVIFLDSDLIVLGNIDKIINLENDFCAANDNQKNKIFFKDTIKTIDINSGLMIINKKYNNTNTFNNLLGIIHKQRMTKLFDQEIINLFFKNKKITYLPLEYNRQVREFYTNNKFKNFQKNNDLILHFTGPKPWLGGIPNCSEMEKIWWKYYNL